jgi:hypothetical protein
VLFIIALKGLYTFEENLSSENTKTGLDLASHAMLGEDGTTISSVEFAAQDRLDDDEDEDDDDDASLRPRCFVEDGKEYCIPSIVGVCCVRAGETREFYAVLPPHFVTSCLRIFCCCRLDRPCQLFERPPFPEFRRSQRAPSFSVHGTDDDEDENDDGDDNGASPPSPVEPRESSIRARPTQTHDDDGDGGQRTTTSNQ